MSQQKKITINDVTIIGGGAVGLSIGYYLKQKNIKTLIIEKNNHFGGESSLRNTGHIAGGIYYKFGSLKSKLAYIGSKYLYAFCKKNNIKYKKIGQLFIALDDESVLNLNKIYNLVKKNKVKGLKKLNSLQVKKIEPNIISKGAILSTSTGIFDPLGFMKKVYSLYKKKGGSYLSNTKFIDSSWDKKNRLWSIRINNKKKIKSRIIINAGGLNSIDIFSKVFPKLNAPVARNIKGAYLNYKGNLKLNHIITPLLNPGTMTERVDASPTIKGKLIFGPSRLLAKTAKDYSFPKGLKEKFYPRIKKYLPKILLNDPVIKKYMVGIRSSLAVEKGKIPDFLIKWENNYSWVQLSGIESPGLTTCLSIGRYVLKMILAKKSINFP